MKINGAALMVGALILLVLPGVFYNNYVNSDLVIQAGSFGLVCPGLPDTTCQSAIVTGCQASSAVCTLSGSSVSFLSGNSPFTFLLTGNIGGLFSSLSAGTQASNHGPFDFWGGGAYTKANCLAFSANPTASLNNIGFAFCTQANTDGSNMTLAQSGTWNNWNTNFNTNPVTALHFFGLSRTNSTGVKMNCATLGQLNYTQGLGGAVVGGYTWYGCDVANVGGSPFPPTLSTLASKQYWSFILAVPFNQPGLAATGRTTCNIDAPGESCWKVSFPVQVEGFETEQCFVTQGNQRQTYSYLVSPQCDQWYSNVIAQTGASGLVWGLLGTFVTFLFGLALFLLGTGINIQGSGSIFGNSAGLSVGSNPQGSKLAQVIGLGLVIWSFLFSEFSSWYTSGFLPYGLDGSFGVVGIAITGSFWFGMFFWATTGTGGDD